jgi:hypothetical protein
MLAIRRLSSITPLLSETVPLLGSVGHGCRQFAKPAESPQMQKTLKAWKALLEEGHVINPCKSLHHPAAKAGFETPIGEPLSLQEAYTPMSTCFGCGTASLWRIL